VKEGFFSLQHNKILHGKHEVYADLFIGQLRRCYGWSTQRTVGRKSQVSPFSNYGCCYSNFSSKATEKYSCYTRPAVDFIY